MRTHRPVLTTSLIALAAVFSLAAAGCGASSQPGVTTDLKGGTDAAKSDLAVPFDVPAADAPADPDAVAPDAILADAPLTDATLDADTMVEGGFGWPCETGDDCNSGYCVPSDQGMVCTDFCYDACPTGWACRMIQYPGQDPTYLCLQTSTNQCRPCSEDKDCTEGETGLPGTRCVSFGPLEGSFCHVPCESAADCPDGHSCAELAFEDGTKPMLCQPDSRKCDCTPYAIQISAKTSCQRVDEAVGTCPGFRVCGESGLTECDAAVPAVEACDSVDNDCDGETDEAVPATACEKPGRDGAVCKGFNQCVEGGLVCDAPDPTDEACDGTDNDCDGAIDEDFTDSDLDSVADCVDPDDDDDGILDEADNCPLVKNNDQKDFDKDGRGDVCDEDDDNDDVLDDVDNCPLLFNPGQEDADGDLIGDACDPDDDNDTVFDAADNCPFAANADQSDVDADGKGDACDGDDDGDGRPDEADNCPLVPNPDQLDTDLDTLGDACDPDDDNDALFDKDDNCPVLPNPEQLDTDLDGMGDLCDPDDDDDGRLDTIDNCPFVQNPEQADTDKDNWGDACDWDADNDTVANESDNCWLVPNLDQKDTDKDGKGDKCDDDSDADGVPDAVDNCPNVANEGQGDLDKDGMGDVCDGDMDGDNIPNDTDNCVVLANPAQQDMDDDDIGDVCDPDKDGDGVENTGDNCADVTNADQLDTDKDGKGDACDTDDDNDGVLDTVDNCALLANADQANNDADALGDACDDDDDNDGVADGADNCPLVKNADQKDYDMDGQGNACDADDDNDGDPDELDCQSLNPDVNHKAQEICNGIDDNCNGVADEENAKGCATWYYDGDGDTYGVATTKCLCKADGMYRATRAGDCDDAKSEVNEGAIEKCNKIDDNCDGVIDPPGAQGSTTYYQDKDSDGYGNPSVKKALCAPDGDYKVTNNTDCNDADKNVRPNAVESCNGVDDNCDGTTDPADSTGCSAFYFDSDLDGYGTAASKCLCKGAGQYTAKNASDCCDTDSAAKPGAGGWFTVARKGCGGFDYNCDGKTDYQWDKNDGGSCSSGFFTCNENAGWVTTPTECGVKRDWITGCSGFWSGCDNVTVSRTQGCI
jgi:hypothetical protein